MKLIDFGVIRHMIYEDVAATPTDAAHRRPLRYPTASSKDEKPGKLRYMAHETFPANLSMVAQPMYGLWASCFSSCFRCASL